MKAPILASGFITDNVSILVSKTIPENIYIKYVIVKDYLTPHNAYFYNNDIEQLYKQLLNNDVSINTIENKLKVIKLAKYLFNNDILSWIELQKKNPFITMSHINFIEDMLQFIFQTGKRKIDTGTWVRLLEPNLVNKQDNVTVSSHIDNVLSMFNANRMNTAKCLTLWLQRQNGYSDLISSLFILFGPRDKVFTV